MTTDTPLLTPLGESAMNILEAAMHVVKWTAKGPMTLTDVINQVEHAVRNVLIPGYTLHGVTFQHGDPNATVLRHSIDRLEVAVCPTNQRVPFTLFVPVGDVTWKPAR